jgi:hypothetical protein
MTDDNKNFVIIALTSAVISGALNRAKLRESYRKLLNRHMEDVNDYNELADRHNDLIEEYHKTVKRGEYLARIIDENEIEIDEFDAIVLNDPM